MDENFILFRAERGDPKGEKLFKKFKIESTPLLLFLDADGKEVDWIAGYSPPPESLLAQIQLIIQGVDTFSSLTTALNKNPKNPEPLIKLGLKYQKRQNREKALECFSKAALLDPDGKIMIRRDTGELISCKEMADYHYAMTHIVTWGLIDMKASKMYVQNYPNGQLLKEAYLELSRFQSLDEEEGRAFYEKFISKFPDDPDVLNKYIERIDRIRQPLENNPAYDKGADFADRIVKVYPEITHFAASENYARLLAEKNDMEAAERAFGEDYLSRQVQSWSDNMLSYAEFWLGRKQNIEKAEEAITTALKLTPEEPGILMRAAAAYYHQLKLPEKALQVFGPKTLPKFKANARALYDYFKFWMTLKTNEESAGKALKMLWELKPDTIYYRIGAATVYWKQGRMEDAFEIFGPDYAIEHMEDMPALYQYGMFWVGKTINLESAVPALTRAMSISPSIWTNHWRAATALDKANKPEAVLKVFGPGYLPHIKDDIDGLSQYAGYWIRKNTNKESAIEAAEMAIRLQDATSLDLHMLAFTFVQAELSYRVEDFYGHEYLPNIKNDSSALYFYASFWNRQNMNLLSALEAAETGCRIDKLNPRQWLTKAKVLSNLGRNEDALKATDKAISLDKYNDVKEELDSLRRQLVEILKKKMRCFKAI